MASFVGANVSIALRSGDAFLARILGVDTDTASLSLERIGSGERCTVRRDELRDVSVAREEDVAAARAAAAPRVAPAAAPQTGAPAPPTTEAVGGAGAGASEPAGTPPKGRRRGGRRSKGGAGSAGTGEASGTSTPTTAQMQSEEFDFSKSLQAFDKKKIWDEIRSQQATDTSTLLVNTNRRGATDAPAQPMLAPNEMVLDPHERDADAPAAPAPAPAPQATAELKAARAELAAVRAQSALLEALVGMQVAPSDEPDTFVCTTYAEPRQAGDGFRRKYGGAAPATDFAGVLRYRVRAPQIAQSAAPSLTYLGPDTTQSDAAIVQRLPDHFRGELNIKLDNAVLFQRRLAELVRTGP